MEKESFLRQLRWRLRLELPERSVKRLTEPYAQFFEQGAAAGKSEAELAAECGDVRLAAEEILSNTVPNRIAHPWMRLVLTAVLWLMLWLTLDRLFLIFGYGVGLWGFPALLLMMGLAMTYLILGGKRLLRMRPEPKREFFMWYGLNAMLVLGYGAMLQFGIVAPFVRASATGVWSEYTLGVERFLGSMLESIGPSVRRLLYLYVALAGLFFLIAALRSIHVGGAYLPLLCVNAGVILACGQYLVMLRTLSDLSSFWQQSQEIYNTVYMGLCLALLVALSVLLARRLKWPHS